MLNTPGLILLEGSDGTGKTTLAEYFVRHHGAKHIHLTYRFKDRMFDYHAGALNRALKMARTHLVVLDRQWPSEVLYAKAYRGGSRWYQAGRMFDRVIRKHASIYVWCLPDSLEAHSTNFQKLKDSRSELFDNVDKVTWYYWQTYYGSADATGNDYADSVAMHGGMQKRADCIKYVISQDGRNLKNFTEKVIWTLRARRYAQYQPALKWDDWNVLGYMPEAKFLFVGDRINKEKRQVDYPFYAHKNSSLFLAQALHDVGFDETRAMWVNVNDPGGIDHVCAIMDETYVIPITMGGEVIKTLKFTGNRHIPHPSYGRRFMGREKYAEVLRAALL